MAGRCAEEQAGMHLVSAASTPAADTDVFATEDVPRRLMRVKVLYTFDDQSRSNCLARLPHGLHIPVLSVDETTEVGIVDLKACIQTIVTASPELVAKLGHDYTVYAYDYSEEDTPLVGHGMLSWILASASPTPNGAVDQAAQVTGRVTKNMLGIFSNGIRETLEVKLKLVPVPTYHQREFIENMGRYRSLSRTMPDGLDYHDWAESLRTDPHLAPRAHAHSAMPPQSDQYAATGDMGFQQRTLTQPLRQPEQSQMDMSRPASPSLSVISFSQYQPSQDARPGSQASFRSDSVAPGQCYAAGAAHVPDQQEEGPPKKRARVTKATRPKKTPLGAKKESLRVTASTAASVRLHRPANSTRASDVTSMEQVPRAPTPRPGDRSLSRVRNFQHVSAPSLLRQASVDEDRMTPFPYDSAMFSDQAVDSADDERGNSPGDTNQDFPSSPPLLNQHSGLISSAPSSPGLPALTYAPDSGFVSDMPLSREDYGLGTKSGVWEGSDLPTVPDTRTRSKQDRSNHPWTEVTPGPVELLPQSYIPKPKTYPRQRKSVDKMEKVVEHAPQAVNPRPFEQADSPMATELVPTEPLPQGHPDTDTSTVAPCGQPQPQGHPDLGMAAPSPPLEPTPKNPQSGTQDSTTTVDLTTNNSTEVSQPESRASTPGVFTKPVRSSKPRGLPRSQTWSAEPMSDSAFTEMSSRQPRSGSGAKRKQTIAEQLQKSLAEGIMPTYCNHCGEIETPTWRKAYTRVEYGVPTDIHLSSEGTSIVGYEVIEPTEDDSHPKYRIFKQALDKVEKESGLFQQLNLCNPCGLWLNKKNAMRPRELWGPKKVNTEKGKRKRNPPKNPRKKAKNSNSEIHSDAIVPHSEPVMGGQDEQPRACTEGPADSYMAQNRRYRSCSSGLSGLAYTSNMDDAATITQSSPGLCANRKSPINPEPDLTPRPTRRLLFPSPRRTGEVKSLGNGEQVSPTAKVVPGVHVSAPLEQEADKENNQPPEDDLAHLFESARTTPTKDGSREIPKTPNTGSRRRAALGTKHDADINCGKGLATPSRNGLTPNRSGRTPAVAPDTPFTRSLNAWFSSPSKALDFTNSFPDLSFTPGRSLGTFPEYSVDDFLSSDMPITSSPNGGLGFSVFEDPASSTVGLWSGASIFDGSDGIAIEGTQSHEDNATAVKTTLISVDLTAMIDGVVRPGSSDGKGADDDNADSSLKEADDAMFV